MTAEARLSARKRLPSRRSLWRARRAYQLTSTRRVHPIRSLWMKQKWEGVDVNHVS